MAQRIPRRDGALRFAVRGLRRQPGFVLVAIVTLALGIGANAAMFSVVHAVLLRPLPYADEEQLVRIRFTRGDADISGMEASLPDIRDWRGEVKELDGLVTWNLFPLLGVQPVTGRGLTAADDAAGAAPVALLGEGLWRSHFGSDPGVLGESVTIRGNDRTIVGVLPADAD